MKAFSLALKNYCKIKELNLSGNFLTETGAEILSDALKHIPTLISLSLENNQIGPIGGLYLKSGLIELKRLESFSIQINGLLAQGVACIMEALSILPHICRLNICMNDIDDEGGLIVCSYLYNLKCLSYLVVDLVLSNDVKSLICASVPEFCKVLCRNAESRIVLKSS